MHFVRKMMKKNSMHIFESYIYEDSTMNQEMPRFVLGNVSSSIRLIAYYNSDPSILCKFLENQKRTHLRTSVFIEICRFLSIFKEYRKMMLDEINNFQTKSVYNGFFLYMFKYLLEQNNQTTLPDYYMDKLEYYYKGYAVHSYFYWKSRKNKKYFTAFFESFTCSFFVREGKFIINGLFYLYPYANILHKYLADYLLNAEGDYESYRKEMRVYWSLEKKQSIVFDPYLQMNAMLNPKILQFCSEESYMMFNISSASSPANTVNSTKTHSFSHFQNKKKKDQKEKKKAFASKIIRSTRKIPYLYHLFYVLPSLMVLGFFISSSPKRRELFAETPKYLYSVHVVQKSFYDLISSIFIPFALRKYSKISLTDVVQCQKAFSFIPLYINQYYVESPILSNHSHFFLILTFHEIADLVYSATDICNIVDNFSTFMHQKAIKRIKLIFSRDRLFIDNIDVNYNLKDRIYYYKQYVLYGSIVIICFLLIYFIVSCITLNTIMSKNEKAIKFLSSEKRVIPILQNPETRESLWEQLPGFDSTIVISNSSILDTENENENLATSTTYLSTINFSTITLSSANQTISTTNNSNLLKHNKSISSVETNESKEQTNLILPSSFSGPDINKLNDNSKLIDQNEIENSENLEPIPELKSTMIELNSHEQPLWNIENEVDMDELIVFLKKKEKEFRCFIFFVLFRILFPWIVFYIFVLFAYYPLSQRNISELDYNKQQFCTAFNFHNAIVLINETLFYYEHGEFTRSNVEEINAIYESHYLPNWHLYFKKTCYNFSEVMCFSISLIVQSLLDGNCSKEFIEIYALPILVIFGEKAAKDVLDQSANSIGINTSSGPSFIFLSCVIFVVIFIIGHFDTVLLRKSMNSLFHFPKYEVIKKEENKEDEFAYTNEASNQGDQKENKNSYDTSSKYSTSPKNSKDVTDSKDSKNSKDSLDSNQSLVVDINFNKVKNVDTILRFPSNIIIITSVTETDEIYSISETCRSLLNRKSSDLICKKMSRLFPLKSSKNDFEIREFNGKSFISKTKTIGKLSKTVLIEEMKSESKIKPANIIQKLINFIPNYFAKSFSEEFINAFHFGHSLLIFIRIDSLADQIDSFFNIINRLDQNFFNIDFIRSNGSILTCVCRETDELEIILYLRDLISSCEENSKRQVKNFALKSVFIDIIDELNAGVIEGDVEPEILFEEEEFFKAENLAFFVDDRCIGFSEESLHIMKSVSKLAKPTKTFCEKNILFITFKEFSDEVISNI